MYIYSMDLTFQTSVIVVILLAALSIAISIYIYRHTVPAVPQAKKILLITLRASAFTLALLALCEPLFRLTSTQHIQPTIAVLIDNSLSMSQTDKTGNREEIVKELLKRESFAKLTTSANAQIYQFSHSLFPLKLDSLTMNGGTTDISTALQSAVENSTTELQSILLITDGNYNTGTNPLYRAERSAIPIFAVGVGDTTEQVDVLLSKLNTNSIGYAGVSIPVDAVIKSSGTGKTFVTASLFEDGKIIEEKRLSLPSSFGTVVETPVQFIYLPKVEGTKKLSVHVSTVAGEITAKNNSRSALVKILKNKFSIVIIAGALSADVSAMMQTLRNDNNINALLFYQLPNGELKSSSPVAVAQALASADCVILAGFPAQQSTAADLRAIQQAIEHHTLPLFFLASRTVDLQKLKSIEHLLPFTVVLNRNDEQTILANVPAQHKYHALVQIHPERFPSFTWEKMPPLFASFQSFAAKPEAQTLLSIKIQGVPLQNPLLLIRSVGNTKSLALLAYGIHRWKLLASTSEETRGVFDEWFSALIRWLSTREKEKQLRIALEKDFYSQGEPIEFSAQVYNDNYQPVENADVRLQLFNAEQKQIDNVSFQSIGSGRYEGTANGVSEGEYSYKATALSNNDTVGVTTGRFTVGEQSVEFAETKMNKRLLQQIANASGGSYSDASQFDFLVEKILARPELKPREQAQTREFELWNLPAYLSIIIILFALEWYIRKQSGML